MGYNPSRLPLCRASLRYFEQSTVRSLSNFGRLSWALIMMPMHHQRVIFTDLVIAVVTNLKLSEMPYLMARAWLEMLIVFILKVYPSLYLSAASHHLLPV